MLMELDPIGTSRRGDANRPELPLELFLNTISLYF
jgi:hypothetical protein